MAAPQCYFVDHCYFVPQWADHCLYFVPQENMLEQPETLTTFGKLSIDKNSSSCSNTIKPLFSALKYIWSPCDKTLSNIVVDQSISGLLWAVITAAKLIKAHCFPLVWALKRSSPWCIVAQRNKAIFTWFLYLPKSFVNSRLTLEPSQETAWNEMRAHYKRNLFDSQPLDFTNVAKFVPPEIRHLNRQTDGHKSRFRLYIDRGERLGRVVVKNSVLPRWRSAAKK